MIVDVEQTRAPNTIGASDAAGALGLDPRNPPLKVWRRLRGEQDYEVVLDAYNNGSRNSAWRWGQILEPVVREWYAQERTVAIVVPTKSQVMDGWLRATPDGIVYARELGFKTGPALGLVQCKCRDSWLEHEWTEHPPAKEEVQCRVEMAVTQLPWCDLVALVGGNRTYIHRIERDLDIEARIVGGLRKFWDSVQAGIEPAVDGSDEWRERIGARMAKQSAVVDASSEVHEILVALQRRSREKASCMGHLLDLRNQLLLHMSAAQATAVQHKVLGRFTAYRAGGGMDWKGYASELEEWIANNADETSRGIIPTQAGFKRPSTTWAIRTPRGFAGDDDE